MNLADFMAMAWAVKVEFTLELVGNTLGPPTKRFETSCENFAVHQHAVTVEDH